jgi:hypothetical protein
VPDIGPFLPGAPPPRFGSSTASGPGIGPLLREFHIPWPAADEAALRDAARYWHTLAEAIRDNYGPANSTAASLTTNNSGAAMTAFETYWQKFGGPKGALPVSAEACDAMSTACTNYANDVASVKRQIEERALEIGAILVVGAIGAFLTFGATEAAADLAAAQLVATAAGWIADIGAGWIADIGAGLSTTVALISETAADAIADTTGSVASAVSSAAGSAAYNTGVASVLGTALAGTVGGVGSFALTAPLQGPLAPSVAGKELLASGFAGFADSALGALGELSAPQLSSLLADAAQGVSSTDPQLASSLAELSRQVAGTTGKIANSTLSSIASQLIAGQQVSAEGFSTDQLQSLLEAIAARGEG